MGAGEREGEEEEEEGEKKERQRRNDQKFETFALHPIPQTTALLSLAVVVKS